MISVKDVSRMNRSQPCIEYRKWISGKVLTQLALASGGRSVVVDKVEKKFHALL